MNYTSTGHSKSYTLCQNSSLNASYIEAADAFTILNPAPNTCGGWALSITLPLKGAMIDLLLSLDEGLTSSSCIVFPFDITPTPDNFSLIANDGLKTCSVTVNGKQYHRWTGAWDNSGPLQLSTTEAQTRIGFSINVKGK